MKRRVIPFLGLNSYYQCFFHKFAGKTRCLLDLMSPVATKNKKKAKDWKKKTKQTIVVLAKKETNIFKWMPEHHEAFDANKEALVTVPVLDFFRF